MAPQVPEAQVQRSLRKSPSRFNRILATETKAGRLFGALLVHSNLQMRLSRCNGEQRKLLKTRENQRVQTGQVGLANRRIQPLCHLSAVWSQQFTTIT